MAREFTIRDEFFCDEDTFWDKAFLDEDFNRRFFFEILKFPDWKLSSQKSQGEGAARKLERAMHVMPSISQVPAALKKFMGDRFSYDETGTYDGASRRYDFSIKTSTLPDKIRCGGSLHTEKLGEKRIVRVARVHVEVKVFALGSLAEDRFLADLKTSYEAAARFTETYLKEKGLWTPPA